MNKKQNIAILFTLVLVVTLGALFLIYGKNRPNGGGQASQGQSESSSPDASPEDTRAEDENAKEQEAVSLIHPEGRTLQTRVDVPAGYERKGKKKENLQTYLRNFKLHKYNYPIHYYDGRKKSNQNGHIGVFELPIEDADLQQCADSIMRVYAEYYWSRGEYDRIAFHFVNGFLAQYSKWRQGYRISVSGNSVSWTPSRRDTSYAGFQEYMKMVFNYASTLSMVEESEKISLEEIKTGDILIKGGSPGHVVLVTDVCENADGKKAFLLAQGYMPAQEFHLLKNPLHEEDPWYYVEEISWPLETPDYTFDRGSVMRPNY